MSNFNKDISICHLNKTSLQSIHAFLIQISVSIENREICILNAEISKNLIIFNFYFQQIINSPLLKFLICLVYVDD